MSNQYVQNVDGVKFIASNLLMDTTGFFTIEVKIKPAFSESSSPGDFDILYFGSNSYKLWFDQVLNNNRFKMNLDAVTLSSNAVTFSSGAEITLRIKLEGLTATLTVSGATTGNGTTTQAISSGIKVPAFIHLLSNPSGQQVEVDLVHISSPNKITLPPPNRIRWHSGYVYQGLSGQLDIPSWMHISCDSTNRYAYVSPAKARAAEANQPRAHQDGYVQGLLAEITTTNVLSNNNTLAFFNEINSPTLENDYSPDHFFEEIKATTSNVNRLETDTLFLADSDAYTFSAFQKIHSTNGTAVLEYLDGNLDPEVSGNAVSDWRRSSQTVNQISNGKLNIRSSASSTSVSSYFGIQMEQNRYPTTFVDGSRDADTLWIDSDALIDEDGYFEANIIYRPHYAHDDLTSDHNILYLDSNNRLFYRASDDRLVLKINNADLISTTLEFDRLEEINVTLEHSALGRSLVVKTEDDDSTSTGAASSPLIPSNYSEIYLFGSSAVEESCDLIYLDTNLEYLEEDRIYSGLLGAGISTFGTGVAGIGNPSQATVITRRVYLDKFNNPGNVKFIDPKTGDYLFNEDGTLQGGDGMEQMVYLALVTVRGSSVVRNLGQNYSELRTIPDNFESLIREEIKIALSDLTENGLIRLDSVDVIRNINNLQRLEILIRWTDLTTNQPAINSIIL